MISEQYGPRHGFKRKPNIAIPHAKKSTPDALFSGMDLVNNRPN